MSETRLLALGFAFERATAAPAWPKMTPTFEAIRGRNGDSAAKPTGEFIESDFQPPVKRSAAGR